MSLKLESNELIELMKNFYTLTGIRIVLFDENYNEILSYPEECIPFCAHMRCHKDFYEKCRQSDKLSFESCKKTQTLTMHKCHAGLIEATAPITDSGAIIGYIMFGQIRDVKNKYEFTQNLAKLCNKYEHFETAGEKIEKIKYKSSKQLVAAAHILEACTSYILLRDLVKPTRMALFNSIDLYISNNLEKELSVDMICRELNIKRTRLYETVRPYINGGIASYIFGKRMARAKELIKNTDMSVTEISSAVGFTDYNYFLRCFKKQNGLSVKKYRESVNHTFAGSTETRS